MQDLTKRKIIEWLVWIGFIIVFVISIPLMYLTAPKKGDVIRIDCTWSEISPDFSIEMKEACRKARANKL
jgi:short subunit fatty acids transporter